MRSCYAILQTILISRHEFKSNRRLVSGYISSSFNTWYKWNAQCQERNVIGKFGILISNNEDNNCWNLTLFIIDLLTLRQLQTFTNKRVTELVLGRSLCGDVTWPGRGRVPTDVYCITCGVGNVLCHWSFYILTLKWNIFNINKICKDYIIKCKLLCLPL